MKHLPFIILLMVLAGCGAQTTGKSVEINNRFVFENCKDVTIDPSVATKSGDIGQEVVAPTSIDTKLDTLIDWLEKTTTLDSFNKVEKAMKALGPEVTTSVVKSHTPIYSRVETYQTKYVEGNPKPFTWLNAPGVSGRILFELSGCDSFSVPDGSVKYSPNGHGHATYFQGSDTPEGIRMDGRASIFMAPRCKNGVLTVTYE